MKIAISIFLGFCFLLQNISKTIIVLNYEANKEYISANLCVNRDKPESCCEGKCELKKQLEKDDKTNNVPESGNKIKFEKNEFCGTGFKLTAYNNNSKNHFTAYSKCTMPGIRLKVFRPPCGIISIG